MALPHELEPLLRQLPLFASLDEDQFRRIARTVRVVPLGPRQMLFQRGDAARHWYVVLAGTLKLAIQAPNGQEKVVERLTPGQSFGEALMFMSVPAYPLAAISIDDSQVLAVPNTEIVAVLKESPEACFRMMAELSRRLHGLVREVEEVTLASARLRLVRYLTDLAGEPTGGPVAVTLPETKQLLASQLAMKPETLSRIFRALTDEGLLAVEGRDIRIADVQRLRAAA
jgi:CRP-like cAMP-binding protein